MATKVYTNALATLYGGRCLDKEKIRRLLESPSVSDYIKMLIDYGYGEASLTSVDDIVAYESQKLIEFIESDCYNDNIAKALTARYYYNDIKLAYKSRFTDVSSVRRAKLAEDVFEDVARGDYSYCSAYAVNALTQLDSIESPSPSAIDIALSVAMYNEIFALTKRGLVNKYFRVEADIKNILTVARCKKLGYSEVELEAELMPCGFLKRSDLIYSLNAKSFSASLYGTDYMDMAEQLENSDFKDVERYETDADDYLYSLSSGLLLSMTSDKPLLNYYTSMLIELKTLKIIAVAVKLGDETLLNSRLRQMYEGG